MGHEIKLVAHFFSSSDLTAQVICWDRGRLARTRIISIVVRKYFSTLFALRAHCRRDAHGPSKSLDHGSVYHLLRSEGVDQYAIHLHRLTAQPGWRKLRPRSQQIT